MTNELIFHDAQLKQWLRFREPSQIVTTDQINQVVPKLQQVESIIQEQNLYGAGFISYEAAPAFDKALQAPNLSSFPLLWFGLYKKPEIIQTSTLYQGSDYKLHNWVPSVSYSEYEQAIALIKEHIARGETYQVNYTFRLHSPFSGNSWKFFWELALAAQAPYAAYLDIDRYTICSASPELFFRLCGNQLLSRPMKGTAPRGSTLIDDIAMAEWLRHSEKNRAENIMIVDMIRNDIGRVADVGSVQVTSLFDIERYPTVWQMTSTVEAKTNNSLCDIMAALFPCASITGAPKPRTMEIISTLETTPRQIYTGCIGFISPHRKAQFNVAIRTVLINKETGQAEYGVGGGIVWDSVSRDEYIECQIKARFLAAPLPWKGEVRAGYDFSLLETILWVPDEGYFLLSYHLRRLEDSAVYFGISVEIEQVRNQLEALVSSFPNQQHKVRLLLAQDGGITCQTTLLFDGGDAFPVRLSLCSTPVDSTNPFLYHKTTNRQVYDTARADYPNCDDVLLWNERGEITETCMANVIVLLNGELLTPPVKCGLLPGTFRAYLLEQGKVREEIVTISDLKQCSSIYVVNSVRKWREAVLNCFRKLT